MDTEQEHEDAAEQRDLSARHRPDERAPNDPPGRAGSGAGDIHAAGTPAGGTAVGGLAGTNVGHGDPDNADLEAAEGSGDFDARLDADGEPAQSGFSGGAVGGVPAGKRTSERVARGISPGGVHRGDSTIGGEPDSPAG